eukprot:CAMPEP_0206239956 /NCGR_PEP_ID=MMETSP0047_2-20121206/15671_1 /ASSEMBLY_ACC=CAM_ASM_000192 /TAXON_ID=195065 /ORGANISM="Chroomonas mesostigmatica_cf, Strain CCMP1168" /LENGTH=96 /DNA_ID=CAMNT_0053664685 /DNA_START=254 /DNA_END=545 /DNA_ORIENTATION=+
MEVPTARDRVSTSSHHLGHQPPSIEAELTHALMSPPPLPPPLAHEVEVTTARDRVSTSSHYLGHQPPSIEAEAHVDAHVLDQEGAREGVVQRRGKP